MKSKLAVGLMSMLALSGMGSVDTVRRIPRGTGFKPGDGTKQTHDDLAMLGRPNPRKMSKGARKRYYAQQANK